MKHDRLPVADVDLQSRDFVADPVSRFDRIRRAGRLVHVPSARALVITGRDDALAALRNPDLRVLEVGSTWGKVGRHFGRDYGAITRLWRIMPFANEGQRHEFLRNLLAQGIVPYSAGHPSFERNLAAKVARFRRDGGSDLAADLARHLLVDLMLDLIQVPESERSGLRALATISWALDPLLSLEDRDSANATVREGLAQLGVHARLMVGKPGGEFLSRLYNALPDTEEDKLGMTAALAAILLIMGNDGIASCVSMGMRQLLDDSAAAPEPRAWRAVSDDVIRMTAPLTFTMRMAAKDVDVAGCPVAAGQPLYVSLLGANHDPAIFGDSRNRLIPGRDTGLAFGGGRHVCVGLRLSRLVVKETLGALGELPRMRLAGPPVHGRGNLIRTIDSLPVEFI